MNQKTANKIEGLLYNALMLYASEAHCFFIKRCSSCRFYQDSLCILGDGIAPFFDSLLRKRYSDSSNGQLLPKPETP